MTFEPRFAAANAIIGHLIRIVRGWGFPKAAIMTSIWIVRFLEGMRPA